MLRGAGDGWLLVGSLVGDAAALLLLLVLLSAPALVLFRLPFLPFVADGLLTDWLTGGDCDDGLGAGCKGGVGG
jgi:hypothetical protein